MMKMITQTWRIEIHCDCTGCANKASLLLDTETLEKGYDCAIIDALTDSHWAVRYPITFCPECVERILNETLAHYVDYASRSKLQDSTPAISDISPEADA